MLTDIEQAAFACASLSKYCVGITLWDFYDPFSWVPYYFAGEGAPSLWFEDFSKHPAYDGIVDSLKSVAAAKGAGKMMGGKVRRWERLPPREE